MRRTFEYGLPLSAIMVLSAVARLYTPDKQQAALAAIYARPPSVFVDILA